MVAVCAPPTFEGICTDSSTHRVGKELFLNCVHEMWTLSWLISLSSAARNLKFYPLSLRKAIGQDAPLSFIADSFKIETCTPGPIKLFKDLSTWELLNLKVSTVLEIPDRLYNEYSISSKFLEDVMRKYTIQSTGKDTLEHQFKIDKPIQYMLATTRHYSWPK